MSPINKSYSRFNIISIYVTTTIVGILLIFIAVYNATIELEIIHEIDHLFNMTSSRLEQSIETRHESFDTADTPTLVSELNNNEYRAYLYTENETFEIGGHKISSKDISDSRANTYGGYISSNESIITWSLVPIPKSAQTLLVTHLYQSHGGMAMFSVYQNKLVIPAVFFIWMTIWGALILNNLIKQIHLQKEEAEHMALHDGLTGLANRHLFAEKLEEHYQHSLRQKLSFCVAVIDLNKFKQINDTYGHDVGDQLLIQVASRFKQVIRSYDVAARFGGDEFVLLLPDLECENCMEIYERIHSTLIEPYQLMGKSLSIGASLGISVFPKHADDPLELMRKADKAMYAAKIQGAGIKVFDETSDI